MNVDAIIHHLQLFTHPNINSHGCTHCQAWLGLQRLGITMCLWLSLLDGFVCCIFQESENLWSLWNAKRLKIFFDWQTIIVCHPSGGPKTQLFQMLNQSTQMQMESQEERWGQNEQRLVQRRHPEIQCLVWNGKRRQRGTQRSVQGAIGNN